MKKVLLLKSLEVPTLRVETFARLKNRVISRFNFCEFSILELLNFAGRTFTNASKTFIFGGKNFRECQWKYNFFFSDNFPHVKLKLSNKKKSVIFSVISKPF